MEKAAEVTGYLYPILTDKNAKATRKRVEIADGGTIFDLGSIEDPQSVLVFNFLDDSNIHLSIGENGPEITLVVRDKFGDILAEICNNCWRVSSAAWDKNYNSSSLEVLDRRGHAVLQVAIRPDRVQLQGEWHDETGRGLILAKSTDEPGAIILLLGEPGKDSKVQIAPNFKYPSKNHWGEFDTPNRQVHQIGFLDFFSLLLFEKDRFFAPC